MYEVRLSPQAQRQLDKLPRDVLTEVLRAIHGLARNPRPVGCLKLRDRPGEWRIRVGKYRVACTIDDMVLRIAVVKVGKREHFY